MCWIATALIVTALTLLGGLKEEPNHEQQNEVEAVYEMEADDSARPLQQRP